MPRPDEGLIHEWLDGELSPEESARVDEMVRTDAEWAAAAAEARGLVAASSRILSALDTVAGDVIPAGSTASGAKPAASMPAAVKARARFTVRPWMRAAAGIAIVVSGTVFVLQSTGRVTEPLVADATAPPAAAESSFASVAAAAPEAATAATGVAPAAAGVASRLDAPAREIASARVRAADSLSPPVAAPTSAPIPEPVQSRLEAQSAPPAQIQALAEARERDVREREVRQALDARVDSALRARSADAAPPALASSASGNVATRRRVAASVAEGVAAGTGGAVAAKALAAPTLEGCWRAASSVPTDTLLRALPIVRSVRDTLELRLDTAGRIATVVRDGDLLRGTVRVGAVGALTRVATMPWRAERRSCPD